jgi:hypothetical protein
MTYLLSVIAQAPNDVYIQGQLAFSGEYMKTYYTLIKNIDAYRTGQIVDYLFMFGYGSLLFTLSIRLARKIEEDTKLAKIAYIIVVIALMTPFFDCIENIWILLTLTDPFNFPNWWAVAQSCFSVLKWGGILISICWNLMGRLFTIIHKK